ncbi:winged helix-turn-helix domain-containing protein [Cellvibrio sp. NN19]|uniref:winged helix-turn-helix domain-containing protein n=1 Tax=Cellvibrio chitinivorans TaxID=3102792 RepID=UPI002B4119DC|nr:winged helix-turn-helix domain-containing protein [Cellvibrio sp. NN19]
MSESKKNSGARLKTQARLMLDDEIAFGPGKAELLVAIQTTGSISAAGKHLGMSYRRAWLLVDAMNRCFQQPLVETATGGNHGGGTQLTALGMDVLERYQQLQQELRALNEKHFPNFAPLLRKNPL